MHAAPSLVDRIAASLRTDVLSGRYRAGDRLPSERELADRFETHRSTIREALKKLEQLGLAEIKPGGARALPVEEASLDVLRHLIELGPTPDPVLFDQALEVFTNLFALSARLGTERADDAQRARVRSILGRLMTDELSQAAEYDLVQELSEAFVDASGNLVLKLVRKGLHTEVVGSIQRPEALFRTSESQRDVLLQQLDDAVVNRDGPAAADAISQITATVRSNAVAILEAERQRAEAARTTDITATERATGGAQR